MPKRNEIEVLVIQTVQQLAQDFDLNGLDNAGPDTALYGGEGPLDSVALVNLIADLEDSVSAKFSAPISLTDEKAMSARQSPYRTVASLTEAISERLSA